MAVWGKLALSWPVPLIILVATQKTEAFVLHDQPPSSINTPQVIARAEQVTTLEPYTGTGALPVAQSWDLLTTELPLHYTPTASNITLRLTLKNSKVKSLDSSKLYSLTVLSLADIADSTAATNGNEYIRHSGQRSSTFATSYPPSNVHFRMAAAEDLPVYVVTDVLRAIQELTHYLWFLELVFEVFGDKDATRPPIASGCLALDCGSQSEKMESRGLEYANTSATNLTTAPSRQLLSSITPVQLTRLDELESIAVTYSDLASPLPIHGQSFADVADRILANITDLIIANQGDGPLPFYGTSDRRLFHHVDTWGSNFGISLLPMNLPGINFTLSQVAMALKTIQNDLSKGPMVESKMEITLDGSLVGWGCLRYSNTSAWRCIMPTAGSTSAVGSESISGAANVIPDLDTDS